MNSIMLEMPVLISVNMDKEEVGLTFENYNLVSAGVVNKENKLVGMITADDVVTVVQEEAEEDALRLAGVGDEEITDSVMLKTKRRFNWLLLNLFTALLATWVISNFGASIEQMVALSFSYANCCINGWKCWNANFSRHYKSYSYKRAIKK